MTSYPSSAVSVAAVMIAFAFATVTISYRTGRAHAAWRDVGAARRDLPRKRRIAWAHTRGLLFIALLLIGTLSAAAWTAH